MKKERLKLIVVAVLAICMLIIGFQNTEPVATRVLFFTVSMPRVLLVLISLLIGFIAGVLLSLQFLKSGERSPQNPADPPRQFPS